MSFFNNNSNNEWTWLTEKIQEINYRPTQWVGVDSDSVSNKIISDNKSNESIYREIEKLGAKIQVVSSLDEPGIPKGFRSLEPGDIIRGSDMYLDYYKLKWKTFNEVNHPYINIKYKFSLGLVCRKLLNLEITEENKQMVIDILTKARAFNEDSALKVGVKLADLCEALNEKNIIGRIGNRFFVDKSK